MSSSNFDLIMPYLRPIEDVIRDEGVSEVMVNGNGRVFVERDGLIEQVVVEPMSQGFVSTAVKTIARVLGGEIDERQILRRIPMGKLGSVDAVGDAAVFLASPLADYITGHHLMVDGGWTAFGAPEDAST